MVARSLVVHHAVRLAGARKAALARRPRPKTFAQNESGGGAAVRRQRAGPTERVPSSIGDRMPSSLAECMPGRVFRVGEPKEQQRSQVVVKKTHPPTHHWRRPTKIKNHLNQLTNYPCRTVVVASQNNSTTAATATQPCCRSRRRRLENAVQK